MRFALLCRSRMMKCDGILMRGIICFYGAMPQDWYTILIGSDTQGICCTELSRFANNKLRKEG